MKQIVLHINLLTTLMIAFLSVKSQVNNIGNIASYKQINGGIEGVTSNGIFDIHVYNNNIIRVRMSKEKAFRNFSYALASNAIPSFQDVHFYEKDNSLFLSTKAIHIEIEKTPSLRIVFRNNDNEIINTDANSFATTFRGDEVTMFKDLQSGERFVGLGEVLGNIDKRGMVFTLSNTDTYKYGDPRLSMYISIPFFIGIHGNKVYGLFINNSHKSVFNFGASTPGYISVTMDGGDLDYFFIHDTTVAGILQHYSHITGTMPLPPKWSLGYQQSRADYYPQQRVLNIGKAFRQKDIPVDCIVLDAEYQNGYQPFLVDSTRFPDLKKLVTDLSAINIEVTASVYPGVKIDSNYHSYRDGVKQDVFLKYVNGAYFETEIAPVKCYLPDYTNPNTRKWWKEKMKWMEQQGIHGYWNDMNEPAVAASYLPPNIMFDFDGKKTTSAEGKNVYGMQMARSSYEAYLQNETNRRPFILTRSAFAGVQRYAAVWSGDNTCSNDGLLSGVLLNSQMGLSGLPFVGPDLGGYIGTGTPELFWRWMQVGVFSPFLRNHKGANTEENEPWSYGATAEAISRAYIGFRYRLMPYIYSKFYEASVNGMPVARSLCINNPFDNRVYDTLYQYQFLFGDAFMIVPVTTQEIRKKIYLPAGEWYNLFNEEMLTGNTELTQYVSAFELPIFVKASSIIPMQETVQSTKEFAGDTLFVHIFNGKNSGSFVLYEDAGDGFEYQKGAFYRRTIKFDPLNRTLLFSKVEGTYSSKFKKLKIIFHGFDKDSRVITINKKNIKTALTNEVLFEPTEFSVVKEEKKLKKAKQYIVVTNTNNPVQLKW